MSKYKPLFLGEAAEHLDGLEGELLGLEKEPANATRIHEVFRHLHSLKSMAASMGYQPMSRLAHRLEDLVAPRREKRQPLEAAESDTLLAGLDILRRQLQAVAEDRKLPELPDEFADRLKALLSGQTLAAPAHAEIREEAAKTEDELPEDFVRVRVQVRVDCGLPAVRALMVCRRLRELGQVHACRPSEQQLRAGHLPDGRIELALEAETDLRRIREALDAMAEIAEVEVERVGQARPRRAAAEPARPKPMGNTVRVRTELLDFVVDSIGELITLRSYFEELAEQLDQPALRDGVRRMNGVVRRLQDRIMDVRMVPASLMTQRLPRICRDLARGSGKRVDFVIEGDTVELDRALAEELDTPLLHLLRNAVDHGLESPEQRKAAGKDPQGKIELSIRRQQDRILVELSDDGAGIDPARLLERGRQLGWLRADEKPSKEEVFDWIFRPGFSTAEQVSDTSGRGVGLDAVRASLERLNGRVSLRSVPGEGTTFVLDLPLTLAILQVLLVELGGQILAIPASRVVRAMAMKLDLLVEAEDGLYQESAGRRLPLADLEVLLEGSGKVADRAEVVWVGRGEEPRLALGFNRLTGHREVVLKSIGPLLRAVGPFSGSTVLGDGRPVLILDVDAVIALEQRVRRGQKT